jgi:hypothetical protein
MAFEILAKLGLNATGFQSGLKRSERDAYGAALKIQRSFEKSAEKIKKAYYDM